MLFRVGWMHRLKGQQDRAVRRGTRRMKRNNKKELERAGKHVRKVARLMRKSKRQVRRLNKKVGQAMDLKKTMDREIRDLVWDELKAKPVREAESKDSIAV